jgi:hypothetical protein
MDFYELIATCHERRRSWADRFRELDSQGTELVSRSLKAIARSRDMLEAGGGCTGSDTLPT